MEFIEVVASYEIPFSLAWVGRCDIKIGDIIIPTIIEKKFVKDGKLGTFDGLEIRRDRKGLSAYSEIELHLPYHVSPEDNGYANYYSNLALLAINRLLHVYRNFMPNEFHIDKVRKVDIISTKFIFVRPDGTAKGLLTVSFPGEMAAAPIIPVPLQAQELLVSTCSYPTWKEALNNAENRFDLDDFPQVIVEANIALESFVHTHIFERLKGIVSEQEIDDFLKGISPCNDCSPQEQKKLVAKIDRNPPSIYKIIRYMYDKVPIEGYSKNAIKKLVEDINKKRNDIVHGRSQVKINKDDAKQSIKSLRILIEESLKIVKNLITLVEYK